MLNLESMVELRNKLIVYYIMRAKARDDWIVGWLEAIKCFLNLEK